jgi:hypothetical protein
LSLCRAGRGLKYRATWRRASACAGEMRIARPSLKLPPSLYGAVAGQVGAGGKSGGGPGLLRRIAGGMKNTARRPFDRLRVPSEVEGAPRPPNWARALGRMGATRLRPYGKTGITESKDSVASVLCSVPSVIHPASRKSIWRLKRSTRSATTRVPLRKPKP